MIHLKKIAGLRISNDHRAVQVKKGSFLWYVTKRRKSNNHGLETWVRNNLQYSG